MYIDKGEKSAKVEKIEELRKREDLMFVGLKRYLEENVGDYLDPDQIDTLADMLRECRTRRGGNTFPAELVRVISEDTDIRHLVVPMRKLRKDEMATLMYNLSPYSMLSRKNVAIMCKECFPNLFASLGTINSMFTRYGKPALTNAGHHTKVRVEIMDPDTLEDYLYKLGNEYGSAE